MKQYKNPPCLICDYVISKDNQPYCTLRQAFTETLPPILCDADCPQRKTWVDRLPDNIFEVLRGLK